MKQHLLNIFMNGIHIGTLQKSHQEGLRFEYTDTWLNTKASRPISLSLPLSHQSYTGDIVYNYFDNLLPDNAQIRNRIQTKFHIRSGHPFDLLACIGKDCVGALQIVKDENYTFTPSFQYETLNENKIATILRNGQNNPLGMTNEFNDFRISLAGAQEKAAFLFHNKKWHIPIGDTPTSHIFKLPIGMIAHQNLDLSASCENEWLCAQLAQVFGLDVAPCTIEYFEDIKVLVVQRFDRQLSADKSWLMRLPQEDMCQALGISGNLKYQSGGGPGIKEIMKLLLRTDNPLHEQDVFFKTQILFWLLCAIDGHAKNFSIFIESNGFRSTPLYDILSAFPMIENKQLSERKVKMAMALKGKNTHYRWEEVRRSHFLATAKYSGYLPQRAETILDEMLEQVETVIDRVTSNLPASFPDNIASPIFNGMKKMKKRLLR